MGLRLACFLSNAEIAVLSRESAGGPASGVQAWILRGPGARIEAYGVEEVLPEYNLEIELVAWGKLQGRLRLFSARDEIKPIQRSLKVCADILAREMLNRDFTQRAQQTAERYRNFMNEISEGIWRCELRRPMPPGLSVKEQVAFIFENGTMAECNPAMARMYGFENSDEIVGAPLAALLIPGDVRNQEYLEEFVRNGYRLRQGESVEKDRHGNVRYFVNNLVGIVSPEGIMGAWGTQTDITAFKELERRLVATAEEAAEANRAKSAFLANISHEIRTPLGVILGFADLALDKPDLSAETKGYISAIRRNGELVAEILGEVLDLSKIEARRMEIEEIRFPLLPMLTEVITFLDLHAREKGLALSLEKIGALPRVINSDPTRLRQILTNLIGNAVKFTPSGHVNVGVRLLSAPRAGEPVELEFTVADSGIGISPELREKLFRPFTQAEASTSRRFGGTGLGLTLSKQLANALGGDLVLRDSGDGQGSTFAFTIKAGPFEGDSPGASASVPEPGAEERAILDGKRILLVEDSEDNQILIKHYLNAVGIDVEVANDGFEGLAKIEKFQYDLVVLDIQMPGMDGHECARSMRDHGYARPIIALTAHAFKEDREKAFNNGFSEYLTKPINRAILLKTLSQRLGGSILH